jgi:hypothetical protein
VYLTSAETQKVAETAEAAEIAGDEEELVRQAFEAIFRGQADDVAYSVTEAAGATWLTPDIWYKERPAVNADTARAMLTQGKKDGTHEGPIPEDDGQAIKLAEELVEMAQTAWDQHVRGPEVEILLRMAAEGEVPGEKQETPPEPPPIADDGEPLDEPPAESPPPEPQQEETDPESEGTPQDEPWEGYDGEKVSEIIGGIDAGAREYSQEEFIDLMSDVWSYESSHKGRKTILDHLEEIARKLQAGESLDEGAEGSDGSAEAPAAEEPAAEPPTPEGGDGDAPAEPAEDVEGQPDGGPEPEEQPVPEPGDGSGEPVEEAPKEEKPKRQRRKKTETPPEDQQKSEEEGDPDYEKLMEKVESDLERERIHKPKKPEEDIPDLPWDWTKMSNGELQMFHSTYSVLAYYKGYQLAREERLALHCKAAADEMHNALLVALDKYDEHGKEKKVALIEAEVESDENVVKWRRRQRKHETFAASHRNERDSVGKIVEALSRHESMRHQEWERSGKLGQRKG